MHVFKDISSLKVYLLEQKKLKQTVGLVPTMGALHNGHAALLSASFDENSITVCSIFVNPVQFNKEEDLKNYPRTEKEDLAMLESLSCDAVFMPQSEEIYPEPARTSFSFGTLESHMEGTHRPGHFNGVALVVAKLFNIISPDRAYFGQKDIQQYKIIEQFCKDLCFDIQLKAVPTVREQDGLALSSRNKRLSLEGRSRAPLINKTLEGIEADLLINKPFLELKRQAYGFLSENNIEVEYLELVSEKDLMPTTEKIENQKVVLSIAASIEGVRLIDNRIF